MCLIFSTAYLIEALDYVFDKFLCKWELEEQSLGGKWQVRNQ